METKSRLRRKMGDAKGAWFWRRPGLFAFKPGKEGQRERVAAILDYRRHRADLAAGRYVDEINERGNIVLRDVDADKALALSPADRLDMARGTGDRYAFDLGPCRGWVQFDTRQDAGYFGVWVDADRRRIFTYCEGDRTLVICPTVDSFRAELADAAEFYGAPIPKALAA